MLKPLLLFIASIYAINADTECPVTLKKNLHQDRRTNKSTLKIMQYNVEWLFVDYYKSADCPGHGCTWANSSESNTHLEYVSKIINEINPDIINLCEVEGCDELNLLSEKLNANYIPYLKKGTDSSTGQNVGMLTQIDPLIDLYRTEDRADYPIIGSKCGYTGAPGNTGVSKHFITEYKLYDRNVAFISAHLLAYPTDPSRCAQREAQAQVIQNVIYSYYKKDYEIIMLGDLNDYDAEILDMNNNDPISQVLDILKGNVGINKGLFQLINLAEIIPKEKRFTEWWDVNADCKPVQQGYSMIDHILVTPFLREKVKDIYIYQNYSQFCGTYNSDHYPVIFEFEL